MFYNQTNVSSRLKMYANKIAIATATLIVLFFAWANLFFHANIDANAATITDLHLAVTVDGVSDQVEGKVEKDIGTVERNVGKITGQTEGALKQAKGEVKEDIGTAKNKLDEAEDNVEDASESLVDSVKSFFN